MTTGGDDVASESDGGPGADRGDAIADRGAIWLTLEATGEAAHGSRPMLGINAIDRLTAAIDRLKREFGTQELDVAPEMAPIVEESVGFHQGELDPETVRDLFRYPTVNLGVIEGGSAVNAVPASARAEVDIRLTATVETRDALGSIRRCLGGIEGISVADVSWSRGSYEPIDSPLVEASTAAAESVVEGRSTAGARPGAVTRKICATTGFRPWSSASERTPPTRSMSTRRSTRSLRTPRRTRGSSVSSRLGSTTEPSVPTTAEFGQSPP